jgi:hypothetical protein
MIESHDDALAVKRHLLISLSRFAGLGVLMFGLYLLYGKQDLAAPALGYVPILLGFLIFFFAPPMLAKRWSSKQDDDAI